MAKQLFKKRYTKKFAETYEVPTSKPNYRLLIVLYPTKKKVIHFMMVIL